MDAAIRAAADSLRQDLTKELEDVRSIIDSLRGIARAGGMPKAS